MSDKNEKLDIKSPIILKLQEDINIEGEQAIKRFWEEIEKKGTPIFENIKDDYEFNLIITQGSTVSLQGWNF